MPDLSKIETKIALLEQDAKSAEQIHNKLEIAIEKLTDITISLKSMLIQQETKMSFERDLENALQNSINTKEIFEIQNKQVETATYNFERSEEQYKLGSITAIEFRQAQINLANAQNQRTIAKYRAKLSELQLIQITGQLLNVDL